ncbi:MAG: hypothetical protein QXP81_09910 [Nitrososphaerota archaeon]
MRDTVRIVLAIIGAAVLYAAYLAAYFGIPEPWKGPVMFAAAPWVLAFGVAIAYGAVHNKMTQGEKGIKGLLKSSFYIMLGWLRHWRLIVAVVFVAIGLTLIGSSVRWYYYMQVTGFNFVVHKRYIDVVTGLGAGSGTVYLDLDALRHLLRVGYGIYPAGTVSVSILVATGTALADVWLQPIPIVTTIPVWYLDMGVVLTGLTLIIVGLIFGLYHGVLANNKLLEQCGEHTARYHVNLLKLYGYEVPEGYEEALVEFYKTGKASRLRQFTG